MTSKDPLGGKTLGAVIQQTRSQLLDPRTQPRHVAAAERALDEAAQPVCFGGSLSRIESACNQLNVAHASSGSRGRKIRPSARSRSTWLQAA